MKIKRKKSTYYHILIYAPNLHSFNRTNIEDIEPYYDTVFIPYQADEESLHINGAALPLNCITSFRVFKSNEKLEHQDDVYENYEEGDEITHDADKYSHDVTVQILSKAQHRINKQRKGLADLNIFRILGIGLFLISVSILFLIMDSFSKIFLFPFAVIIFVAVNSIPMIIKNKWEYKTFEISMSVISLAITILLAA